MKKSVVCFVMGLLLTTAALSSDTSVWNVQAGVADQERIPNVTVDSTTPFAVDGDYVVEDQVLVQYLGSDKNVVIPDDLGITEIGEKAFYNNETVHTVFVPDGVTKIGNSAFYYCSNLKEIQMPESVTDIGEWAFLRCSLSTIFVPDSVVSIGDGAFISCSNIIVDENNTEYSDIDGVLFNKAQTTLIQWAGKDNTANYVIPDGVTGIGKFAFNGSSLESIEIPDSVVSIEDGGGLGKSFEYFRR